jgi:thymidine phosphorylase
MTNSNIANVRYEVWTKRDGKFNATEKVFTTMEEAQTYVASVKSKKVSAGVCRVS